jgi:hypothetical protein
MNIFDSAESVVTIIGIIGGFALNAYVQYRNGKRADANAVATKVIVTETRDVLHGVAANTDGRLTEVIEKSGVLEEQQRASLKEISELRAALVVEQAKPKRRPNGRIARQAKEIAELQRQQKEQEGRQDA